MINKSRKNRCHYNIKDLKSGYEAMGSINLGFAETSAALDNSEFFSYEKNLVNDRLVSKVFPDLESDPFDD